MYDIEFAWELKSDGGAVSIGPVSGRLEHGHSEQCQLTFLSDRPVILKRCQLILRVSSVLLSTSDCQTESIIANTALCIASCADML